MLVLPHAKSASLVRYSRMRYLPDQLYDFLWVSVVQTVVWLLGGIDGLFYVIDECLLFFVLIIVKHRVPAPWERRP